MDKYALDLEDKLKEIKECQESKDSNSCFNCSEWWNCIIRLDYVKSVYQSMNKGKSGDFEFN